MLYLKKEVVLIIQFFQNVVIKKKIQVFGNLWKEVLLMMVNQEKKLRQKNFKYK